MATMMKAEIKGVHSPDVADLEAWEPPSSSFCVSVQVLVGPENDQSEESFDIFVCSSEWLVEETARQGVVDGRHRLIVRSWNWSMIMEYLERRVRTVTGDDWTGVALQISRLGHWEFEDYREAG
jgi:hypothetical protein